MVNLEIISLRVQSTSVNVPGSNIYVYYPVYQIT